MEEGEDGKPDLLSEREKAKFATRQKHVCAPGAFAALGYTTQQTARSNTAVLSHIQNLRDSAVDLASVIQD